MREKTSFTEVFFCRRRTFYDYTVFRCCAFSVSAFPPCVPCVTAFSAPPCSKSAVFPVLPAPLCRRVPLPTSLYCRAFFRLTRFTAAAPLFCRRQKILLRDTQKKHPQCAKHRRCKLKLKQSNYSLIAITTPEPTVLPPSRIAKRSPFSIAMGLRSSTSISTLSPGMHISVPSGREITPVTSVVLK